MKAYSLMLIVFIFTASLSFVTNLDIVTGGVSEVGIAGDNTETYVSKRVIEVGEFTETASDKAVETQATFSWYNAIYKVVIYGFPLVVKMLFDSTVGLPLLLMTLGVPIPLAALISTVAWIIYIAGMLQWITNRSFRQHE